MATVRPSVLLPSAVYAADQTSEARNNGNSGVHVILDVSSLEAGSPSVTMNIQAHDPGSDSWYPLLIGLAVTTVGTNVYKVGRGLVGVANAAAADGLPRRWRVFVDHADAQDIEYSVGFNYLA